MNSMGFLSIRPSSPRTLNIKIKERKVGCEPCQPTRYSVPLKVTPNQRFRYSWASHETLLKCVWSTCTEPVPAAFIVTSTMNVLYQSDMMSYYRNI